MFVAGEGGEGRAFYSFWGFKVGKAVEREGGESRTWVKFQGESRRICEGIL